MRYISVKRVAAALAAGGVLAAGSVIVVPSTFAQVPANLCVPTALGGGIGNDTGNGSSTGGPGGCVAAGTSITQQGNNTATSFAFGNFGFAICGPIGGGTQIGPNICPVINGDSNVSSSSHAGHSAEGETTAGDAPGGSSKKGKKKKKK